MLCTGSADDDDEAAAADANEEGALVAGRVLTAEASHCCSVHSHPVMLCSCPRAGVLANIFKAMTFFSLNSKMKRDGDHKAKESQL